jgi:hypothetical protein
LIVHKVGVLKSVAFAHKPFENHEIMREIETFLLQPMKHGRPVKLMKWRFPPDSITFIRQ